MAYGTGPYSLFVSLPAPPRPEVSSARNIDFATKRYMLDDTTGGFERMSPTCQRVVILVAQAAQPSQFNTEPEHNAAKAAIVKALEVLTAAQPPQIKLKSVECTSPTSGTGKWEIRFKDLTVGTDIDQTVQV